MSADRSPTCEPPAPPRAVADWFGAEVRHWRRHRALTVKALARRVNAAPALVGQVEAGACPCPAPLALALDEVLGTGGVLFRAWPLLHAGTAAPGPAPYAPAPRPAPPGPDAVLPDHVLARSDVREALAAHDFGTVFRLARKWGGISYSRIAIACDMNPARVGHLAKGNGRVTTHDKITEIADALRVPGRLVGLQPRPWEAAG
ncbi:helix-turn-helix domain-containing protein [Actinorugispora endophytica]|uniref:Helix-turn-helix protein n=1 Tax=Actinorugispora endophytica TaxID=1605990 RepID=A0A4V3D8Z0_9ACTN|nr:helix-turn-helix transcriptional regulator [Actinorugispora endophytica]TDQ53790.1 helix-turn-helix protein [Actinorugispora endophytica]